MVSNCNCAGRFHGSHSRGECPLCCRSLRHTTQVPSYARTHTHSFILLLRNQLKAPTSTSGLSYHFLVNPSSLDGEKSALNSHSPFSAFTILCSLSWGYSMPLAPIRSSKQRKKARANLLPPAIFNTMHRSSKRFDSGTLLQHCAQSHIFILYYLYI